MKFKILVWLLALVFSLTVQSVRAENNSLRIEQEAKLLVPQEKTEAVWQWLQDYFVNNQQIKQLDPLLTARSSEERFTDTYYDDPKLKLLDKLNSVRHRKRENLTNPADRKSGQELIQIKLSDITDNRLTRGEFKFEVDLENSYLSNQHPLLGIIKANQRNDFINQLADMEIPVNSLRQILVINDLRRRIYLDKEQTPFISISLDQVMVKRWWAKAEFTEIESELNEITFTESNEADRKYMEEINHQIIDKIKQQFPEITSDLSPKYNKAFNGLEAKIPFFRFLIRWGII